MFSFALLNSDLSELPDFTQLNSYIVYRKYNRVVEVRVIADNLSISNSGLTLGTLPQNVRPVYSILQLSNLSLNPSTAIPQAGIQNNGIVSVTTWASGTYNIRAYFTYLV